LRSFAAPQLKDSQVSPPVNTRRNRFQHVKGQLWVRYWWYGGKLVRHTRNFDPRGNLILCSTPRGGSTWLAELLSQVPQTALLFEPLHLWRKPPFRDLNLCGYQPIPEHADWPEARAAFDAVFRGRFVNGWTGHQSSVPAFLLAKRMLVKMVRANAMLPWLIRNFQFINRPVLFVRHPLAVVASQLRFGFLRGGFRGFRIPDCPFNEHFLRHRDFLAGLRTAEEGLAARWCLANQVPLGSPDNDRAWTTVYYEHLLLDPERELRRIFDNWELPLPRRIMNRVRVPSAKTLDPRFLSKPERQLDKWRRAFNDEQLERLIAVLDHFGFPGGYGLDPMPRVTRASTALPVESE
jgi:hypothetical protein